MSGYSFLAEGCMLLSGVALALSCGLVFGMFRKKPADARSGPEIPRPPAVMPVPRSSSEKRDAVMVMVREMEAYLDRINAGGVNEDERKWQNKLRMELEGIKRSVDAGDFPAAKRRLSGAEMYARMVELHVAGR